MAGATRIGVQSSLVNAQLSQRREIDFTQVESECATGPSGAIDLVPWHSPPMYRTHYASIFHESHAVFLRSGRFDSYFWMNPMLFLWI